MMLKTIRVGCRACGRENELKLNLLDKVDKICCTKCGRVLLKKTDFVSEEDPVGTVPLAVCRRCGRRLKNPKYIEIGMGRVCQKKLEAERKLKEACEAATSQTTEQNPISSLSRDELDSKEEDS